MKKKIITLCLVIAMLSVAVIGGTLAYFTDEEQARNEFTIGNVEIDLYEKIGQIDNANNVKVETEDKIGFGLDTDTEREYAPIMPGDKMTKEITVDNLGSEGTYIAVSVKHSKYRTFNTYIDAYYEGLMTDEKGNPVAEKIAAVNKTLGTSYTTVEETMQYITDAIWTGSGWNLWYDKHSASPVIGETFGTRYYPEVERADQTGAWNHATERPTEPVLIAVDYVVDQDETKYGHLATFQDRSGYAENMLHTIDAYESLEDNNRMWVYYYYVPGNAEGVERQNVINLDLSFNCPTWIDNTSIKAFDDMVIDVQTAAIQASGFANAEAAFQVIADQLGFETNG